MGADTDFDAHLKELRRLYVRATPKQRLSIAKQRMTRPQDGPNRLVACVSAVEGFARCLVMHQASKTKDELEAAYPKYRQCGPTELVALFLSQQGELPETAFGDETWLDFGYAVKYRNFLVHEATYLGHDISPRLINACEKIVQRLAELAGVGSAA